MFAEIAILLCLICLGALFLFKPSSSSSSSSSPSPSSSSSSSISDNNNSATPSTCPFGNIPSVDYEFAFSSYTCPAAGRELGAEKGEHAVAVTFNGGPVLLTREPETVDKLTVVTSGVIKFVPPCETLLYGKVVWAQTGKPWQKARRALLKAMDSAYVSRLLVALHDRVSALVEKFVADSAKSDIVDVYDPIRDLLRELVATAVLGTHLANDKPEAVEQMIRFHKVSTRERVALHWWIHGTKAAEMGIDEAQELVEVVGETVATLSEAYERAVDSQCDDEYWADSLLAGLAGLGCDRETAVHNAMGLMIAGINTTAAGVVFALYELGKASHTEWQERLVNEVPKGEAQLPSLNELPQLKLVLTEVMRMYPPFPTLFPRLFSEPAQVARHNCPANSMVIVDVAGMQHREEIFQNPHQFDPERWLPERSAAYPVGSLITFGSNTTQCPGKPIAYAFMAQLVMTMLQRLRVSVPDDFVVKNVEQFELAPEKMLLKLSLRE